MKWPVTVLSARLITKLVIGVIGTVWWLSAQAAPIQYIFTGTASGRLGAIDFSNSALTITFSGDTSAITGPSSDGIFTISNLTNTIELDETETLSGGFFGEILGSVPVLSDTNGHFPPNPFATTYLGFESGANPVLLLNTANSGLDGYDLSNTVDPPVPLDLLFLSSDPFSVKSFDTGSVAQLLTLSNVTENEFQAATSPPPPSVPEPDSLALLALTFAVLAIVSHRRRS